MLSHEATDPSSWVRLVGSIPSLSVRHECRYLMPTITTGDGRVLPALPGVVVRRFPSPPQPFVDRVQRVRLETLYRGSSRAPLGIPAELSGFCEGRGE